MRLVRFFLASLLTLSSFQSLASEKIEGDLYSRRFSAHTHYVIDQEKGFIGVYTKAKAFLMPIKDNRTFTVDPENLLSEVIKDMEPGTKYSLDIKSESPRYEATIISVDPEKNQAVVKVKDYNDVIDLSMVLDLSAEVVNLKSTRIKLLRVGGVTLDVSR